MAEQSQENVSTMEYKLPSVMQDAQSSLNFNLFRILEYISNFSAIGLQVNNFHSSIPMEDLLEIKKFALAKIEKYMNEAKELLKDK
jgi:hypothetical protein